MDGRRERIRRILSVGALGVAVAVLVATSRAEETTGQRFVFDPLTFDGEDTVVEGEVRPSDDVAPAWNRRQVTVTVRSDHPESMLLLELLDASGRLIASSVQAGEFHRVYDEGHCGDGVCDDPVTYRIQSLDGDRVTVEPSVDLSFRGEDEDEPDVAIEASSPDVVPRTGDARAAVLASATLRADRQDPVSAIWVSWTSGTCEQPGTPRVARLSTAAEQDGLRTWLFTVGGEEDETPMAQATTYPSSLVCEEVGPGRWRHSSWIVLHTERDAADVDIAIVGPEGHPPVQIELARVTGSPVAHVRGADHHIVRHEVRRPDPRTVYLLGLAPLPPGVEARYDGPDLDGTFERSAACGRCAHLELRVAIETVPAAPPPVRAEAQVVLHEIAVS